MPVTNVYKTIQLSVLQSAVVYAALGAHVDNLNALLNSDTLPAFSRDNMVIELAAAEEAMSALSRAKVTA